MQVPRPGSEEELDASLPLIQCRWGGLWRIRGGGVIGTEGDGQVDAEVMEGREEGGVQGGEED
jgi:hypothetical protein